MADSTGSQLKVEASHMNLLARCELGGFGCGEGIGLYASRGRRFLFVAHLAAPKNFSVIDVTDPRRPRVLAQVDLPHDQMRSNSLSLFDDTIAIAYETRVPGMKPAGVEFFDLSRPDRPRPIGFLDTSGPHSRGAHYVNCVGGTAYLSTGMHDFEPSDPRDDQFVVIADVRNPQRPQTIGRWWLPGTRLGDLVPAPARHPVQIADAGFRSHNVNVDPARPARAYVGYLDAGIIILDISNPASPKQISRLDYHPPLPGFTHTALPLIGRELLVVTDEAVLDHGADHPKRLWIVDISHEVTPLIVGTAPMPPKELFSSRGGRFGAHNVHENNASPTSWRSEEVIVGAFFNAGVRAFDIRDPYQPRELGHLIPEGPPGSPAGAIQMNDVYVDERGVIYAVDRFNGGLYTIEAAW
jgi:hypothetical protein